MSVADINYLKKNISKCRWQISRSFRRTPRHWQNICETLQVRAISGSGYVYPEKLKHPLLPSGVRIPDVNIRVEWRRQQNSRCDTSGWKWRRPDVMAAIGWNSYPGGMSYDSRPGGMNRIPYSLYFGFAYRFQRTLLNLGLLW